MKKQYINPSTTTIYMEVSAPLAESIQVNTGGSSVPAEDAAGKNMNVYPGKLWETDEYDEEE
ncbi:MAG: hypothetical protein IJ549_02445 [Prevotella sp.]|nr:hypothetical protein [Prevotella sp.]